MDMKIAAIETLHCDAGWRNYHFVKLTTTDGIVGWSAFATAQADRWTVAKQNILTLTRYRPGRPPE